ncbi:hypothetical protein [Polyangium aurulentum]|uniref:hypothetical protein n=1 Tax=Polyangium aurulentum TaxID=2567896 RepID=UPI0010AEC325|nr:hypothetical protein [Polyangium aurulentum]UQA56378.1 hypothetical protein E8A73_034430 [Polyangium aurulentum]
MRWRDFLPAPGVGPWQGLELEVLRDDLPAGAPGLRVEAARPGRVRITCGGTPAIWAHIDPSHRGLWRLIAPHAGSWEVVPPLRASDLAAIEALPGSEAWWKAWARHLARALVSSPRGPLYPGPWAITAARSVDLPGRPVPGLPAADRSRLEWVEAVREGLDAPTLDWEPWWLSGSGGLLRMRDPSAADAGRVRAWRKRARDGTLPPALVLWVSGLDMFLLLDGHDRLQAAAQEGVPPRFLVLRAVRWVPERPDPERQRAIVEGIERQRRLAGGARLLTTDKENQLLVEAFDDRPWLVFATRAYPLPGGAAAWDEEVGAQPGVTPEHGILSGEPPSGARS